LRKTGTFETRLSGPKNNCLILGAGRSGTSLTGLLLERAGYHVYRTAHPPDEGNPFGYFEDLEVIKANEAVLGPIYRSAWQRILRAFKKKPKMTGLAWLLDFDPRFLNTVSLKPPHADKFRELFARTPFAYKDPRFSFTLGALAPIIPENTKYICVFRNPLRVVESTKKHALRNKMILEDQYCFEVWLAHYRCLLQHYRELGGQWLFVSYEQLQNGDALSRIEEFLTVELDRTLVKLDLSRTQVHGVLPARIVEVFDRLNELEKANISTQAVDFSS
jgi:hypothetical protein